MRSIIALGLSFPIYYSAYETHNYVVVACCIVLQLLAGLDFRFNNK